MSPLRAVQIWEQLSHTCFSFIATTYASFVAVTLVIGCICMALLFFSEITIAASFRDLACDRCDTGGFGRRIVIDRSNRVDYNRGY